MLYLNVPYEEKEEAKKRYAKWDKHKKKWYATNPKYYYRFKKWIEGNSIVKDKLYIAVANKTCWKCQRETPVYAVTIKSEDLIDLVNGIKNMELETGFDMAVIPISENIPKIIKSYLIKNTACQERYSNTVKESYFANVCVKCDALQGDFFVYSEFNSPFYRNNNGEIILLEFKLKNDISIDYIVGSDMIDPPIQLFDINMVQSVSNIN